MIPVPTLPSLRLRTLLPLSARTHCGFRSQRPLHATASSANVDTSGSSRLFADAEREEEEERANPPRPPPQLPVNEQANWDGDESVQDTVLRMLVDKYKPLRSGPIRTAEEKLKQHPPTLRSTGPALVTTLPSTSAASVNETLANGPLLPSVEGHRPWHTVFKAPSHATANVRLGRIPPPSSSRRSTIGVDDLPSHKDKQDKKRLAEVGRLTHARESTMDYKMGIKSRFMARANPVSMRGWQGLIEERIERARNEGRFKDIKGRGKPIVRQMDEGNPFIPREEFLMNRIVQRNGAAPPWVELQTELEDALSTFRTLLRQSWTRQALRVLTTANPPGLLHTITAADIAALRDSHWTTRERGFHDASLREVNAVIQRYNGVAPYPVRKAYLALDAELEKAYQESVQEVLEGLRERISEYDGSLGREAGGPTDLGATVSSVFMWESLGVLDIIRGWVNRLRR